MLSHTVPRKLLEQFAYDDPRTKSKRLWQYEKGRAPWWKASPKSATRWEGHFADPANAEKEAHLELRLKKEFEDPVNQFLESIGAPSFRWNDERIGLLTGYITMLFNRTSARRAASVEIANTKNDAFRALLSDERKLAEIAHHQMTDLIERGVPFDGVWTKHGVRRAIEKQIAEHSTPDEPQRDYIYAIETIHGLPRRENAKWPMGGSAYERY